jgi:two-component system, cell cycle response regulator DivK
MLLRLLPTVPIRGRRKAEPPTVLVVDDDMDARRMYADYLRVNGCVVFTAADGRSGLDKTNDLCPDVVVLDLAMPRVDGWTVLKTIRESSWTEQIPVVVVTAVGETRDTAFMMGCDAYLTKPCVPETLWQQVRAILRWQELRSRRGLRRAMAT